MQLIPAIDLRHGEVVRLVQGDDGRRKSYALDPREVQGRYATAGCELIHVVDLDAAFGEAPQHRLIAELASGPTRIELGGGLRDRGAVVRALDAGCQRVVMGSIVARDFEAFAEIVSAFPARVVPALELARGKLRIAGWTEEARQSLEDVARCLAGLDCPAVLVTDVERDGTLAGPNLELASRVARLTGLPALLSGGIRSLDDLCAAARLPEIAGAIVGKALYEGLFTVGEALEAVGIPGVETPGYPLSPYGLDAETPGVVGGMMAPSGAKTAQADVERDQGETGRETRDDRRGKGAGEP